MDMGRGSPLANESGLVMLVDDDADNREILSEFLSMAGWRVVECGNGARALRALQRGLRPCLILLDLMMPVMNGWEFRTEQLHSPAFADIPVAVISAAGKDHETIERDLGEVFFLPKPIDLDGLLGILGQVDGASPA